MVGRNHFQAGEAAIIGSFLREEVEVVGEIPWLVFIAVFHGVGVRGNDDQRLRRIGM